MLSRERVAASGLRLARTRLAFVVVVAVLRIVGLCGEHAKAARFHAFPRLEIAFGREPAPQQLADRRRTARHALLETEIVQRAQLVLIEHDLEALDAPGLVIVAAHEIPRNPDLSPVAASFRYLLN